MPDPHPPIDLDRILAAVRDEAKRRGAGRRPGVAAADEHSAASGFARRPALLGEPRHLRDFLALSSEHMLDVAYRRLLKRPPDPTGLDNYRRALRTGRRTKVEVLGLLRFSAEGRRQQARIPGLVPGFLLALVYRVPVVGWLAAGVAQLLALPPHLRDRSRSEQIAQEVTAEIEG
jgi:O-antigen chain-terminating methyltransferase